MSKKYIKGNSISSSVKYYRELTTDSTQAQENDLTLLCDIFTKEDVTLPCEEFSDQTLPDEDFENMIAYITAKMDVTQKENSLLDKQWEDIDGEVRDYDSIPEKNYTLLEYSMLNDFENSMTEVYMHSTADSTVTTIDLFDGIFYNISQTSWHTSVSFVSRVLFDLYAEKMKSDYGLITDDNLSFYTYINGLECHVSIDIPGGCIHVMGNGHKQWRKFTFVNAMKCLLRSYLDHSKLI